MRIKHRGMYKHPSDSQSETYLNVAAADQSVTDQSASSTYSAEDQSVPVARLNPLPPTCCKFPLADKHAKLNTAAMHSPCYLIPTATAPTFPPLRLTSPAHLWHHKILVRPTWYGSGWSSGSACPELHAYSHCLQLWSLSNQVSSSWFLFFLQNLCSVLIELNSSAPSNRF